MPEPYVSIPETITVHLGAPSSNAQNVTVPFADYIKNVASSEIYPTWPEQAIRANVYAQMSYVLNRVFTEWYRAQGYDFDITNSTRYDQSFVPGRDIFENISTICLLYTSGTRTSRPEYMLMRSLRSSRVAMNQSRLSTNISRILAAFLSSDSSLGARAQVSR